MEKPITLPEWDTTQVNSVAPDATHKEQGWLAPGGVPEKPPFQTFNYWMNETYIWIDFLNSLSGNVKFLSEWDGDMPAAIAAIAATSTTLIINIAPDAIVADLEIPSTLAVFALKGYILSIGSSYTLTINGSFSAGLYEVFSGDGDVVFDDGAENIWPQWFGAVGDGITDDTIPLQYVLTNYQKIKLQGNYAVSTVTIPGIGKNINFNGSGIIGIASSATDAVVEITGRELSIWGMKVSQDFNMNYNGAVRWHSVSAGAPAQYNNIYGLYISNATRGIIFGNRIGESAVDAAQSENTVYSYDARAVQIPFEGNQPNGFITFMSPIMASMPFEWTTKAAYTGDPDAWNTAAAAFKNDVGNLKIIGGEILKTESQLGYGMNGRSFKIFDVVIEIGGTQAYVSGSASISDSGGYMASDSAPAFVNDPAATGTLTLDKYSLTRGAGVSVYSAALFFSNSIATAPIFKVSIKDSILIEWRWSTEAGVDFTTGVLLDIVNTVFDGNFTTTIDFSNANTLTYLDIERFGTSIPDALGTTTPHGNWAYTTVYGGGAGWNRNLTPGLPGYATSITVVSTGQSFINTPTGTSGFFVHAGSPIFVNLWGNKTEGLHKLQISYFDSAGAALSATVVEIIGGLAFWKECYSVYIPPAGAVYASIKIISELGTLDVTGVRLYESGNTRK